MSNKDIAILMKVFDRDRDGILEYNEFINVIEN